MPVGRDVPVPLPPQRALGRDVESHVPPQRALGRDVLVGRGDVGRGGACRHNFDYVLYTNFTSIY